MPERPTLPRSPASQPSQGGAAPRLLPARRTRTLFAALPGIVRAGAAFLGIGLAADLTYHLLSRGRSAASHAAGLAGLIHALVLLGMALCITGVIHAGIRSVRSSRGGNVR